MLVAIAALVVAMSGTAVAASKLVSGDNLVKKNSLSGNRLKNHSVYWNKIKWSSVGTVNNAKNAANAANATTLDGQSASAFDAASNFTRTGFASVNEGGSQTLAQFGPFVLTLHCSTDTGYPDAYVSAASSQSYATAGGQTISAGGSTASAVAETDSSYYGGSPTSFADGLSDVDFTAPGGGLWVGHVATQTNNPGHSGQCAAFATIQKVH
ncbi:MAG: hypothetical protein ACRDPA_00990 [Solirubrobacteraceae bacterium]